MDFLLDASFIAIVFKTIFLLVAFYLFYRQMGEVFRPLDSLSALRWQILSVLGLSIISGIPSLVYQFVRWGGGEAELLRQVATITSNVSQLAIVILLLMIFTYRRKE